MKSVCVYVLVGLKAFPFGILCCVLGLILLNPILAGNCFLPCVLLMSFETC